MRNLGRSRALPMFGLVACMIVALATGCTGDEATAPRRAGTLSIGLLTPVTGMRAALGKDATQGAQLALDVVNNDYPDLPLPLGPSAGVRGGTTLTLRIGDTQSAADRAEQQAAELSRGGVVGLLLADEAPVAAAAGRQADLVAIALVDALSTADLFADLNRSGHFRIQPSDRSIVQTALDMLYRQRAIGQPVQIVAVVASSSTNVTGVAGEQVELIKREVTERGTASGYQTGPVFAYGMDGAEAGRLANAVSGSEADVVFAVVTTAAEAAAASDLAARLRGATPVVAIGPAVELLDVTRSVHPDLLRAGGWSAEYTRRHPIAAAVSSLYERRFGAKMNATAAAAFSATLALAMAIESAASPTVTGVRGAVHQLSIPATQMIMPWNGIRFDGNGNNELAAGLVEQQSPIGFRVVHPLDLAAASLRWPA